MLDIYTFFAMNEEELLLLRMKKDRLSGGL